MKPNSRQQLPDPDSRFSCLPVAAVLPLQNSGSFQGLFRCGAKRPRFSLSCWGFSGFNSRLNFPLISRI